MLRRSGRQKAEPDRFIQQSFVSPSRTQSEQESPPVTSTRDRDVRRRKSQAKRHLDYADRESEDTNDEDIPEQIAQATQPRSKTKKRGRRGSIAKRQETEEHYKNATNTVVSEKPHFRKKSPERPRRHAHSASTIEKFDVGSETESERSESATIATALADQRDKDLSRRLWDKTSAASSSSSKKKLLKKADESFLSPSVDRSGSGSKKRKKKSRDPKSRKPLKMSPGSSGDPALSFRIRLRRVGDEAYEAVTPGSFRARKSQAPEKLKEKHGPRREHDTESADELASALMRDNHQGSSNSSISSADSDDLSERAASSAKRKRKAKHLSSNKSVRHLDTSSKERGKGRGQRKPSKEEETDSDSEATDLKPSLEVLRIRRKRKRAAMSRLKNELKLWYGDATESGGGSQDRQSFGDDKLNASKRSASDPLQGWKSVLVEKKQKQGALTPIRRTKFDSEKNLFTCFLSPTREKFFSSVDVLIHLGALKREEASSKQIAATEARKRAKRIFGGQVISKMSDSIASSPAADTAAATETGKTSPAPIVYPELLNYPLPIDRLSVLRPGYITSIPAFHQEKIVYPVYFQCFRLISLNLGTSPELFVPAICDITWQKSRPADPELLVNGVKPVFRVRCYSPFRYAVEDTSPSSAWSAFLSVVSERGKHIASDDRADLTDNTQEDLLADPDYSLQYIKEICDKGDDDTLTPWDIHQLQLHCLGRGVASFLWTATESGKDLKYTAEDASSAHSDVDKIVFLSEKSRSPLQFDCITSHGRKLVLSGKVLCSNALSPPLCYQGKFTSSAQIDKEHEENIIGGKIEDAIRRKRVKSLTLIAAKALRDPFSLNAAAAPLVEALAGIENCENYRFRAERLIHATYAIPLTSPSSTSLASPSPFSSSATSGKEDNEEWIIYEDSDDEQDNNSSSSGLSSSSSTSSSSSSSEEELEKLLRREEMGERKEERKRKKEEEKKQRQLAREMQKREREGKKQQAIRKRKEREQENLERKLLAEEEKKQKEYEREAKARERKREFAERKLMTEEEKSLRKAYRLEEKEREIQRRRDEQQRAKALREEERRQEKERREEDRRAERTLRSQQQQLLRRRAEEHAYLLEEYERAQREHEEKAKQLAKAVEQCAWTRVKGEVASLLHSVANSDSLDRLVEENTPEQDDDTKRDDNQAMSSQPRAMSIDSSEKIFCNLSEDLHGDMLNIWTFTSMFFPVLGLNAIKHSDMEELIAPKSLFAGSTPANISGGDRTAQEGQRRSLYPNSVMEETPLRFTAMIDPPFVEHWQKFAGLAFALVKSVLPEIWRYRGAGEKDRDASIAAAGAGQDGGPDARREVLVAVNSDLDKQRPISSVTWPELARHGLLTAIYKEKEVPEERIRHAIWGTGVTLTEKKRSVASSSFGAGGRRKGGSSSNAQDRSSVSIRTKMERAAEHPLVVLLRHRLEERGKTLVFAAKEAKRDHLKRQAEQRKNSSELQKEDISKSSFEAVSIVDGPKARDESVDGQVMIAASSPFSTAPTSLISPAITPNPPLELQSTVQQPLPPFRDPRLGGGGGERLGLIDLLRKTALAINGKEWATPFRLPVDGNSYPDYYIRIKKPVDLYTILKKLDDGEYVENFLEETEEAEAEEERRNREEELNHPSEGAPEGYQRDHDVNGGQESDKEHFKQGLTSKSTSHNLTLAVVEGFRADMRQIWRNCHLYNDASSDICQMVDKLSAAFERLDDEWITPFLSAAEEEEQRLKHGAEEAKEAEEINDYALTSHTILASDLLDEDLCRHCHGLHDIEHMLLCDRCDAAFHTYCLQPALGEIPDEDWYCPRCMANDEFWSGANAFNSMAVSRDEVELFEVENIQEDEERRMLQAVELLSKDDISSITVPERVLLLRALCDMVFRLSGDLQSAISEGELRTEEARRKLDGDSLRDLRRLWADFGPSSSSSVSRRQHSSGTLLSDELVAVPVNTFSQSAPTLASSGGEPLRYVLRVRNCKKENGEQAVSKADSKDLNFAVSDSNDANIAQSEHGLQLAHSSLASQSPVKGRGLLSGPATGAEMSNDSNRASEGNGFQITTEEIELDVENDELELSTFTKPHLKRISLRVEKSVQRTLNEDKLNDLISVADDPAGQGPDKTANKTPAFQDHKDGTTQDGITCASLDIAVGAFDTRTDALAAGSDEKKLPDYEAKPTNIPSSMDVEAHESLLPAHTFNADCEIVSGVGDIAHPQNIQDHQGEGIDKPVHDLNESQVQVLTPSAAVEIVAENITSHNEGIFSFTESSSDSSSDSDMTSDSEFPSDSDLESDNESHTKEYNDKELETEVTTMAGEGSYAEDGGTGASSSGTSSSSDSTSDIDSEYNDDDQEELLMYYLEQEENARTTEAIQNNVAINQIATKKRCAVCGLLDEAKSGGIFKFRIPTFRAELRRLLRHNTKQREDESTKGIVPSSVFAEMGQEFDSQQPSTSAASTSPSAATASNANAAWAESPEQFVTVLNPQLFMTLKLNKDGRVEIAGFVKQTDGSPGEIEKDGRFQVGEVLSSINEEKLPVQSLALADVIQSIRTASRPLRLGFRRVAPKIKPSLPSTSSLVMKEADSDKIKATVATGIRNSADLGTKDYNASSPDFEDNTNRGLRGPEVDYIREDLHLMCASAFVEARLEALKLLKLYLRAEAAERFIQAMLARVSPFGCDKTGHWYYRYSNDEAIYVDRKEKGWWRFAGKEQITELYKSLIAARTRESNILCEQLILRFPFLDGDSSRVLHSLLEVAMDEKPLPEVHLNPSESGVAFEEAIIPAKPRGRGRPRTRNVETSKDASSSDDESSSNNEDGDEGEDEGEGGEKISVLPLSSASFTACSASSSCKHVINPPHVQLRSAKIVAKIESKLAALRQLALEEERKRKEEEDMRQHRKAQALEKREAVLREQRETDEKLLKERVLHTEFFQKILRIALPRAAHAWTMFLGNPTQINLNRLAMECEDSLFNTLEFLGDEKEKAKELAKGDRAAFSQSSSPGSDGSTSSCLAASNVALSLSQFHAVAASVMAISLGSLLLRETFRLSEIATDASKVLQDTTVNELRVASITLLTSVFLYLAKPSRKTAEAANSAWRAITRPSLLVTAKSRLETLNNPATKLSNPAGLKERKAARFQLLNIVKQMLEADSLVRFTFPLAFSTPAGAELPAFIARISRGPPGHSNSSSLATSSASASHSATLISTSKKGPVMKRKERDENREAPVISSAPGNSDKLLASTVSPVNTSFLEVASQPQTSVPWTTSSSSISRTSGLPVSMTVSMPSASALTMTNANNVAMMNLLEAQIHQLSQAGQTPPPAFVLSTTTSQSSGSIFSPTLGSMNPNITDSGLLNLDISGLEGSAVLGPSISGYNGIGASNLDLGLSSGMPLGGTSINLPATMDSQPMINSAGGPALQLSQWNEWQSDFQQQQQQLALNALLGSGSTGFIDRQTALLAARAVAMRHAQIQQQRRQQQLRQQQLQQQLLFGVSQFPDLHGNNVVISTSGNTPIDVAQAYPASSGPLYLGPIPATSQQVGSFSAAQSTPSISASTKTHISQISPSLNSLTSVPVVVSGNATNPLYTETSSPSLARKTTAEEGNTGESPKRAVPATKKQKLVGSVGAGENSAPQPSSIEVVVDGGTLGLMLEPAMGRRAIITGFVEGTRNAEKIQSAGVGLYWYLESIAGEDLSNLNLSETVKAIGRTANMPKRKVKFVRVQAASSSVSSNTSRKPGTPTTPPAQTEDPPTPFVRAVRQLRKILKAHTPPLVIYPKPIRLEIDASLEEEDDDSEEEILEHPPSSQVLNPSPGVGQVGTSLGRGATTPARISYTSSNNSPKTSLRKRKAEGRDANDELGESDTEDLSKKNLKECFKKAKAAKENTLTAFEASQAGDSLSNERKNATELNILKSSSGNQEENASLGYGEEEDLEDAEDEGSELDDAPFETAGHTGESVETTLMKVRAKILLGTDAIGPIGSSKSPTRHANQEGSSPSVMIWTPELPPPASFLEYVRAGIMAVEAAMPREGFRIGRWSNPMRIAWGEKVLAARNSRDLMEALLVLESVILPDYIENWYFVTGYTPPTFALRRTTLAAVALRLQLLDRAILYSRLPPKRRQQQQQAIALSLLSPSSAGPPQSTGVERFQLDEGDYSHLSLESVRILGEWMMSPDHIQHPFPSEGELRDLAKATGARPKQISHWFEDHRESVWKPFLLSFSSSGGGNVAKKSTTAEKRTSRLASPPSEKTPNPRGRPSKSAKKSRKKNRQDSPTYRKLVESYDLVLPAHPLPTPTPGVSPGSLSSPSSPTALAKALGTAIIRRCVAILRRVMASPHAFPFNEPVDPQQVPGYHAIIKNPMDLGTIQKKLTGGEYQGVDAYKAFVTDVQLVWSNCFVFNLKGSAIYGMAEKLSALFDRHWLKWICNPLAEDPSTFLSAEVTETTICSDDDSCQACGSPDSSEFLLLCDRCDAQYHTFCLEPKLSAVPKGDWFCSQCCSLRTDVDLVEGQIITPLPLGDLKTLEDKTHVGLPDAAVAEQIGTATTSIVDKKRVLDTSHGDYQQTTSQTNEGGLPTDAHTDAQDVNAEEGKRTDSHLDQRDMVQLDSGVRVAKDWMDSLLSMRPARIWARATMVAKNQMKSPGPKHQSK